MRLLQSPLQFKPLTENLQALFLRRAGILVANAQQRYPASTFKKLLSRQNLFRRRHRTGFEHFLGYNSSMSRCVSGGGV